MSTPPPAPRPNPHQASSRDAAPRLTPNVAWLQSVNAGRRSPPRRIPIAPRPQAGSTRNHASALVAIPKPVAAASEPCGDRRARKRSPYAAPSVRTGRVVRHDTDRDFVGDRRRGCDVVVPNAAAAQMPEPASKVAGAEALRPEQRGEEPQRADIHRERSRHTRQGDGSHRQSVSVSPSVPLSSNRHRSASATGGSPTKVRHVHREVAARTDPPS